MMQNRELVEAYGRWLNEFSWDYFVTLTFNKPQSLYTVRQAFEKYVSNFKEEIAYFRVIEDSYSSFKIHIHALLGRTSKIPASTIEKAWKEKYGIAQVLKYDKTRGAAYYITKSINSDKTDWDLNIKKEEKGNSQFKQNMSDLLEDL